MLDTMSGIWTHDRPKVREWRGQRDVTCIQPKRDGWYLGCYMQEDPSIGLCAFGRKHEAHLEYSHLFEQLDLPPCARRPLDWWEKLKKLPPHSSVVGELWVPGKPSSAVVTAMRGAPHTLRFSPFAVPWWRGLDMSQYDVRTGNEYIGKELGLDVIPTMNYAGESPDELMRAARHWDAEGVVLKKSNFDGWYKLKEEHTADLVCTRLVPGDEFGRHSDAPCGSLEGGVYRRGDFGTGRGITKLTPVADVAGMTDEVRAAVTPGCVGRVFEVRYQYLGAGGRLRHPRFVRWRDDKPANECTWDQFTRDASPVVEGT